MQHAFRLLTFSLILLSSTLPAQVQVNGSFPFQNDPAKEYSIYIPSAYQEGHATAAFLALHPLNPANWDAQRWCEEIADFAEENDVILICPDGGEDGAIDDPIDTAFTTVMIDSAMTWYSIAPDSLYAMGFSWGGKTTYTYGLNHVDKFAGFMPIGAATSIDDFDGIGQNAEEKPFYIIHGGNDSPNTRFYPIIEKLEAENAFVESVLMPGIGHTIWFPNQVEILTDGYHWLRENSASIVGVEDQTRNGSLSLLSKENYSPGMPLQFTTALSQRVQIYDLSGTLLQSTHISNIKAPLDCGIYIVTSGAISQKIIVQ